jgi:hypothetical protein
MPRASKNLKKKQKPSKGKQTSKGSDITKNYAFMRLEDYVVMTFIERIQKLKGKRPQVEITLWV